jgi:hypothetical protein
MAPSLTVRADMLIRTMCNAAIELARDMRFAVRSLLRAKGLAATVIVTLGLGIGANAAIFSVVRGVLPVEAPLSPVFDTETGNPAELPYLVGDEPNAQAQGVRCDQQVHRADRLNLFCQTSPAACRRLPSPVDRTARLQAGR